MGLAISTIDAIIVLAYLGAVVGFGLWIGSGRQTLTGYLLGGRDLPWWAILGSIVATETSTATFLSVPGIAYAKTGDMRFLQLAIGYIVGRVLVAVLLLPQYFRGNLYTAYEVLDKRFGGATKQAASLMFLVARNVGDGLRLFLTGIVLEKVVGLSLPVCIVTVGLATIAYTYLGGMKAVIWSDCVQFVVYMAGGIAAAIILADALPGGASQWWTFAREHGKDVVFDFRILPADKFSLLTEPFTFWSGLFGGAVLTLGTHGTDQMMVQRYLCARSQWDAGQALILSGLVVLVQFALFLVVGVGLACFYATVSPDTKFDRDDEVFATFIVQNLPVGLVGVTLAAAFAAAMSTLSSSLNSSAAAAVNDFYRPLVAPESTPDDMVRTSKLLTLIFGVIQIGVGIAASYISRNVVSDALAVAGFTAGVLLGVFCLGVFTQRVGQRAALVGMIAGVGVLTFIKFGTSVAWPWYALIGWTSTFGVGYAVSWIVPREYSTPANGASRWDDDKLS